MFIGEIKKEREYLMKLRGTKMVPILLCHFFGPPCMSTPENNRLYILCLHRATKTENKEKTKIE